MALTFATDVVMNQDKKIKTKIIDLPTTASGSTYGPGSNGQIIKSNGTNAYWADDNEIATLNEIDALFN